MYLLKYLFAINAANMPHSIVVKYIGNNRIVKKLIANNGEITTPSNAATSVSYTISLDTIANTLTADIDFGGGWWGFIYQKTTLTAVQPNTYDVTFHRPIFNDEGKVTRKAKFHVIHNGHVIHDNLELSGGTGWRGPHSISEYKKHGDKGPLKMQDHGNPVRFRNVWVVPIKD